MLLPTMRVQLIVPIEPTPTEATFGMTFETCLIDSARVVISKSLVFLELSLSE